MHHFVLVFLFLFYSANQAFASDNITFSEPTGQYTVGHQSFEFPDQSRQDPYESTQKRKLKVTVSYPSNDQSKLEPYGLEESIFWQRELEEEDLDPSLLKAAMEQVDCLKVYKTSGAQPIADTCPVILFEHGFGVTAGSYQLILQELVSHGYIVVATHHPHIADTVVFQDQSQAFLKAERNNLTIETGLKDVQFVLSSCLDQMEPLSEIMDLENIGMLGHSLGGITTMKTTRTNSSLKAAVQMDAPTDDKVVKQAMDFDSGSDFHSPFLHLFTEAGALEHGATISLEQDNFMAVIKGIKHNSFADHGVLKDLLPVVKEQGWTCGAGKNDGLEKLQTIAPLIRAFFDRYLKANTEINLMAFSNEEVKIKTNENEF